MQGIVDLNSLDAGPLQDLYLAYVSGVFLGGRVK